MSTEREMSGDDGAGTVENEVTRVVVDVAVDVHRRLGPGLLESVYQAILAHELSKRGLRVIREMEVPVMWDGIRLDLGFRADLLVEDCVLVELKSVEKTAPVHMKQLLTHLKLMDKRLGLVLNFGAALMKDGIHRVANGL